MTSIEDKLWTFISVQRRMILRDNTVSRQSGRVFSLQRLCRDAIVMTFPSFNPKAVVRSMVDRLEENITVNVKNQLSTSYSEILNTVKEN